MHGRIVNVVFVILPALLFAGCGSKTGGLIAEVGQDARSCVSSIASKPEYSILKSSTNIEKPQFINADMISNRNFATKEEAIAFKNLHDEVGPCKRRIFEGAVALAPDLQLILIKSEIKGTQNVSNLINRKITWGQFNQNVVQFIGNLNVETRPIMQRLQARVNLEERQAAIARQQALQALGILADTALTLHAISEANRPVITNCTDNRLGTINCVSR